MKTTLTVNVKPEHIAQACKHLRVVKLKSGPVYTVTGENNPAVLAIRDRLSHTEAGKAWMATWVDPKDGALAQIGKRTYRLPSVVATMEGEFLVKGTCPDYAFELPREPMPVVKQGELL